MPPTDPNNDQGQGQQPPVSPPPAQGGDLAQQIRQVSQELAQTQQQLKDLQTARTTLETANQQLTQQLTQAQGQLQAATTGLQTAQGELTNWSTRYSQLTTQHQEVTQQYGTTQQRLSLFETIKEDPKYHPLIGVVDAIKIEATPEAQKIVFDTLLNTIQGANRAAVSNFQAGGTPVGTGGGPGAGPVTSTGIPANPQAAHAEYQALLHDLSPTAHARRGQLMEYMTQSQYGNGNTRQPA